MPRQAKTWTEAELNAAVKAYLSMLDSEIAGRTYNKAEVNRELRSDVLSIRSKASVEYRMQNISAALQEMGLTFITGYKPAKNVGSNVIAELQTMLVQLKPEVLMPTAEAPELEKRVSAARRVIKEGSQPPTGQEAPKTNTSTSVSYVRCPNVKAWVLENAAGTCEGCGTVAPFTTDSGHPFLEVHHVKHLADGGADTISNAVALCPNCHRRCHYSSDRDVFTSSLFDRIGRLRKS